MTWCFATIDQIFRLQSKKKSIYEAEDLWTRNLTYDIGISDHKRLY